MNPLDLVGEHLILPVGGSELARILKQRIVKQVDRTDGLRAVALSNPAAITIYRRYEADSIQNGRIAAMDVRDFADEVEQGLNGFMPTFVEGYNEVAQRQGQGLERYADWTQAYVEEMRQRNPLYQVLGFSFSVGNPGVASLGDPLDDFQYLYNRGYSGVAAIAYHAYWGTDPLDRYYAFRYRAMHAAVPSHPPFIFSEGGRDNIKGAGSGWKASGITAQQYAGEIVLVATEMAKDSYVHGLTLFTGTPTYDWAAFDTTDVPYDSGMSTPTNLDPIIAEIMAKYPGVDASQAQAAILNGIASGDIADDTPEAIRAYFKLDDPAPVPTSPSGQGLVLGSGVDAMIKAHQMTPLSSETYLPPAYVESVTAVKVADAAGIPKEAYLHWHKDRQEFGLTFPDGLILTDDPASHPH